MHGFRQVGLLLPLSIEFMEQELGRPLGYLVFSLMALIGDHIY